MRNENACSRTRPITDAPKTLARNRWGGGPSRIYSISINTYGGKAIFGSSDNAAEVIVLLQALASKAGAAEIICTVLPNRVEAIVELYRDVALGDFVAVLKIRTASGISSITNTPTHRIWAPGYLAKPFRPKDFPSQLMDRKAIPTSLAPHLSTPTSPPRS